MKRYLPILLVIAMIITLTACDGGGTITNAVENNINDADISYSVVQYLGEIGVSDALGSRRIPYSDITDTAVTQLVEVFEHVTVFGRDGGQIIDRDFFEAVITAEGTRIDYMFGDGTVYTDIVGIMADAPELSITQAFHNAVEHLHKGERVLMFLLDGWGWDKFNFHIDSAPFLSSLNPSHALVAYPPMTPVGLATILTGQLPNVHGVHTRSDRRLREGVQDIFGHAQSEGHTVSYIQGHSGIVQVSITPIMSPAVDGKYGTDNAIFENAKRNLDAQLLFVHFHGIDDEGHTYGPYAPQVGERMALIDGYVRYLVENFGPATVIITADHGMREITGNPNRLGDHLSISHEEMIVPYILYQSGR